MISTPLLLASILIIAAVVIAGTLMHGNGLVKDLDRLPIWHAGSPPSVAIVVAARNEEKTIENSLQSLLALDYPKKTIVVVNDRSDDRTALVLKRLSDKFPSIKTIHVSELPKGWLGKNHAHYVGATSASSDILLFTDADIIWEPSSLSRAVQYFEDHRLDHLAVLPRVDTKGWSLATVIVGFQFFFNLFVRPWSVKNSKSFAYVGIGAFNMMRRTAYEAIGTHRAIAMRPDDDMRLGHRIKKKGLRSDFLFGVNMLHVEWYSSVHNLIQGLMKNSFSGANYHLSLIALGSVVVATFFIAPFAMIFLSTGLARVLHLATSLLLLWSVAKNAKRLDLNPWLSMGFPFVMVLLLYIVWKASLLTIVRGGIEWRGTFYSLKELRGFSPDHR